MVEHHLAKVGVASSSLVFRSIYSSIAQLVEQSAVNRSVVGSSPTGSTINIAEIYPSLAEGTGLENQQRINVLRGFESLNLRHLLKNLISRDGAVW